MKEAQIVLTPTDFNRLIAGVAEGTAEVAVKLYVVPLGTQLVDATKIRRVIENLVRNALDAMPHGGTLTISAGIENGAIVIRVSDTGLGIAPEYLPRLFKAFESTKAQGMGLGLAFCKQIVEAHGGTMGVESKLTVGTTFVVRSPSRPTPG